MAAAHRTRIAIACQGGGSHTAFTAGVLKRLLGAQEYEVVALSGTSGGAVCALLAWCGLAAGDPKRGVDLLEAFWADNSAKDPWDVGLNSSLVQASRLEGAVMLPAVSPYFYPPFAKTRFRRLLERHVPSYEDLPGMPGPLLLVGAVDVLSGEFKVFSSSRGEITLDAILASAAVPNLFRAVPIEGRVYWDGLFSQNPPVRELPDARPDEIWVVQVNPSSRASEPMSLTDIIDRRNELSGNLSLEQELFFIGKINELVASGVISGDRYREISVGKIVIDRDLDFASKLDRSPAFIADLMDHGVEQASAFLAGRAPAEEAPVP